MSKKQRVMDALVGKKINRLVPVKFLFKRAGKRYWLCDCVCGNTKIVTAGNLVSGHTKSCGCFNAEVTRKRSTIHGLSRKPTHNSWCAMKQRCTDAKKSNFKYYGGRGVSFCKRWGKFSNFLKDMGVRPRGTSLDRIDPHGNYTPKNCRWADRVTQANNRRGHED